MESHEGPLGRAGYEGERSEGSQEQRSTSGRLERR